MSRHAGHSVSSWIPDRYSANLRVKGGWQWYAVLPPSWPLTWSATVASWARMPKASLVFTISINGASGGEQRDQNLSRALELATTAVEFSPLDPAPHVLSALDHEFRREFDKASAKADTARDREGNVRS